MKSTAERSVEALTWAAVVIWLGFALVTHLLEWVWLVVMVLGLILLSSAIYQRSRGWQTALSLWIAGIWMAVFSVVEVVDTLIAAMGNGDGLNIDLWVYMGVALLSMGVAVVLRSVQAPNLGQRDSGAENAYRRPGAAGERYPGANFTARAHQETSSASWPPQDDAAYGAPGWDQSYQQPPPRAPQGSPQYAPQGMPPQYPPQAPPRGDWDAPSAQPSSGSGWNTQYEDWDYQWEASPRRTAATRRRPPRQSAPPPPQQPPPRQPPAAAPNDFETRVEDIIRRSRERRDRDNLPY